MSIREVLYWNKISKGKKLKIIIRYFNFYDFDMDIDICIYILKNFMKPNLRFINNYIDSTIVADNSKFKLSNFPVYFGCEKIFRNKILIEQTRCNGCRSRKGISNDSDIIKINKYYYNVCQCGKNYCERCFQEFFMKDKEVNNIKCRGCSNINDVKDIDKYKSGILPYDLSKLEFTLNISTYSINIDFYDVKPKYMYGKKKCYSIKLDMYNYNTNSLLYGGNISIHDIQLKIIRLQNYYRNHKYTKLIVFSKFYHFINEIFFYYYGTVIKYLKRIDIYKNPDKMLEVFIVLNSINKYV